MSAVSPTGGKSRKASENIEYVYHSILMKMDENARAAGNDDMLARIAKAQEANGGPKHQNFSTALLVSEGEECDDVVRLAAIRVAKAMGMEFVEGPALDALVAGGGIDPDKHFVFTHWEPTFPAQEQELRQQQKKDQENGINQQTKQAIGSVILMGDFTNDNLQNFRLSDIHDRAECRQREPSFRDTKLGLEGAFLVATTVETEDRLDMATKNRMPIFPVSLAEIETARDGVRFACLMQSMRGASSEQAWAAVKVAEEMGLPRKKQI